MGKFLNDFLLTMPSIQRSELQQILNQETTGLTLVETTAVKQELDRLMSQIETNKNFTFQARQQEHKTNSLIHNTNMEELAFDLQVLFKLSAMIDVYMQSHTQLTRSGLISIKKNLNQLKQQLMRFQMMANQGSPYSEYIYESFENANYTEVNEEELLVLAKGRYDEQMDASEHAEIIGNTLVMAGVQTVDQLKTNYGRKLADIQVRARSGYATVAVGHEIDKAADSSLESYWAEQILVDAPIQVADPRQWQSDLPNNDLSGALCEIEIQLQSLATVSDIHIDPFASYPMEIVSIVGYETREFGGKVYNLIGMNHPSENQQNKKSTSKMIFRFPSVDVGSLRILVRQENYSKENYLIKENDLQNMKVWNELSTNDEILDDIKADNETMASFNLKNEVSGWSTYLEALKKWATGIKQTGLIAAAEKAMESIRRGDYQNGLLLQLKALKEDTEIPEDLKDAFHAVNKVSYIYGAYNISIFGRKYKNQSVYVTKPLNLSSNTKRITLSTNEFHQTANRGMSNQQESLTDIEYYFTSKKNPTYQEWIPVCPVNKRFITSERLMGDSIGGDYPELDEQEHIIVYSFRFPSTSKANVDVKKDGQSMHRSMFIVSDDCKKVGILSKYYSASSIYTVAYQPVDDAYYFDIDESTGVEPIQYIHENGETGERFTSIQAGGSMDLRHVPYLSRTYLFEKTRRDSNYGQAKNVLNERSPEFPIHIWADDKELINITDYDSQTYDPARLEENGGYTFAQIGKHIVLGNPTDKTVFGLIKVDYRYILTNIRLKAILRRNTLDSESVTPSLYDYTIQCETRDQGA